MNEYPQFAMYGHHKCATMSLNTIAGAVCKRLGLRFKAVYDEFQFDENLQQYCVTHKIDFLAYGNADVRYVKELPAHRGFHIVRDPRDIVVSAYFSHRNSHSVSTWKALKPHREKLRQLSKEAGLAEEIRFRQRSFQHIRDWDYSQAGIAEIKFEDLAAKHYETLLDAFDHLGLLDKSDYTFWKRQAGSYREIASYLYKLLRWPLPARLGPRKIPASELLTIIWRNRFEAQAEGRGQGEEDVSKHYRKGRPGDWSNHFTDEHKTLFKQLYPGLLPGLGYQDSDNW